MASDKGNETENIVSRKAMLSIVVLALLFTGITSYYINYYYLDDTHQDTNHWLFEMRLYVNYQLRMFLIMVSR